MFDTHGHIRLIDFGLAKQQASQSLRSTTCGTPLYMTPEGVRNAMSNAERARQRTTPSIGPSADWYTLGTLMFELLAGQPPFQHENQMRLFEIIVENSPPLQQLVKVNASKHMVNCIERLMDKNPDTRLGHGGHAEIKRHALYSDGDENRVPLDWDKLERRELTPEFTPNPKVRANFDPDLRQYSVGEIIGSDTQQALDPAVSQRLQQDGQDIFANWHYSRDLSRDQAFRRAARAAVASGANERRADQYSGDSVQGAAHSNGLATWCEEGVPPARSSAASGGLVGPEPEPES